MVVALGATAAKALLGPAFKVTTQRGEVVTWPDGRMVTATVHPSAILRLDDDVRATAFDDLRAVAELLPG